MAININWENEHGEIIEVWEDFLLPWDKSFFTKPELLNKTCCIRFIDHYGDTTFNQFQIPVFISELEMLLAASDDAEEKLGIESLLTFTRKADGNTHTYIKFWGD